MVRLICTAGLALSVQPQYFPDLQQSDFSCSAWLDMADRHRTWLMALDQRGRNIDAYIESLEDHMRLVVGNDYQSANRMLARARKSKESNASLIRETEPIQPPPGQRIFRLRGAKSVVRDE